MYNYLILQYTTIVNNITVCRGSVVVTAYDFESDRQGLNPELGAIYYKASITAQGSTWAFILSG